VSTYVSLLAPVDGALDVSWPPKTVPLFIVAKVTNSAIGGLR